MIYFTARFVITGEIRWHFEPDREDKNEEININFYYYKDEDAMHAGVELERGILQGFKDSCAAIFFITPEFKDENYLATEINYAIAEKREKGNRFAIISLIFRDQEGNSNLVPGLLTTYIWKEPQNDLEALREIIKALPIKLGSIEWKVD